MLQLHCGTAAGWTQITRTLLTEAFNREHMKNDTLKGENNPRKRTFPQNSGVYQPQLKRSGTSASHTEPLFKLLSRCGLTAKWLEIIQTIFSQNKWLNRLDKNQIVAFLYFSLQHNQKVQSNIKYFRTQCIMHYIASYTWHKHAGAKVQ